VPTCALFAACVALLACNLFLSGPETDETLPFVLLVAVSGGAGALFGTLLRK
jgi:hypothetical protein